MVTASISLPRAARTPRRAPFRDRVTAGGAALASIAGLVGIIALVAAALLVVPIAALIAFGPALLAVL